MEQKYLVIGGLALIAIALVAGVLFAPSGYVVATKNIACVKLGMGTERCDGVSDYWKTHTYRSRLICEQDVDDSEPHGRGCQGYRCSCKLVE